jgi:hypothetical protein
MIAWSVVVGVLGVLVTGGGTAYVSGRKHGASPHLCWILGLAALLPAWLLAFLGLLGPSPAGRPEGSLGASFIVSSSAALLGIIVTDGAVRRLSASEGGRRPLTYWCLGLAALLPAWGIALLGLIWTRP